MTAAKKAAPPSRKKAVPAGRNPRGAKADSRTPKKPGPKKATPAAKKSVPSTKRMVSKKATPAVKKAALTPKKKSGPAARKAAPAPKRPTPKKAAPTPKKAAPAPSAKASLHKAKAPTPQKVAAAPKRPTVGPYAKEPKFLEEQRALLLEERSIYRGQALDLRAEADSLALEREPGDVQFDEESGEGGTVTVDRERNLALSAQAAAAVEEIDDAMRKIDRKTYGGCERCYQSIPKARLRALPFARLCVACKSGGLSRR
ncbi:MAG TPA: TraR/DksA C4-type zinc finger protein [Acidimicrobiales bacterium]|nr:TraR/DksA C4-type zinc finger protein [Acidimicrobiales bacterium]